MANVIEIVIRAKDQATAQLKAAEAASESLSSRLGSFALAAGVAAGAAAALANSVYGLAKSFADEVEQLSNVAKVSGATIQQVQVLNRVLEESGLGANSGAQAMMFLSRAIARNDELLAKLGITARDPYEAMLQLSDAFARSNDQATKNGVAFQLLGRGGAEMVVVLDNLRTSASGMNDELARTGGLISEADAAIGSAADVIIEQATRRIDGLIKRLKVGAALMVLYASSMMGGGGTRSGAPRMIPGVEVTADGDRVDSLDAARRALARGSGGRSRGAIDLSDAFGGAPGLRTGKAATPFEAMVKTLREVEVPAARLTETGTKLARALEAAEATASAFTSSLQGAWSQTLASVTQITAQTNNVVVQLLIDLGNAIIRTITDAVAQAAGSAVGRFIGAAIGFALAPATGGTSLIGSAGAVSGGSGAGIGPRGGATGFGNTYVIQSFDARSTLQEIVSPSGSFRRAGDRVRELRRA